MFNVGPQVGRRQTPDLNCSNFIFPSPESVAYLDLADQIQKCLDGVDRLLYFALGNIGR